MRLFLIGTVCGLLFTSAIPVALAQDAAIQRETLVDTGTMNDFVVGPGKIELEIAPGETETFELTIANRIGETKEFTIALEDISGSNDPEQPVLLLGTDTGPYSLRDYLTLSTSTITIAHGERVRIPVSVTLPPNTSPGGKYGSIVVSIVSNPVEGASASSAIVSRIGTLVFVTTAGDRHASGNLEKFSIVGDKKILQKGPVTFGILYRNTGNVHINPYGELRIYNMLNQEVGATPLDPWYVLPEAVRVRDVVWNKSPLFGRYTAVLSLHNGYDAVPTVATYSFYVINWWVVGVVVLVLVVLISLLRRRRR